MTVKFRRDDFRKEAAGTHGLFKNIPARRRPPFRNRLLMVQIVVGAVIVFLVVFNARQNSVQSTPRPAVQETNGVVAAKSIEQLESAQSIYSVDIQVVTPDNLTLTQRVPTDSESWNRVVEGQEIAVRYRLNRAGNILTVLTLNLIVPEQPETGETP